jgi:hypothetical protein
MIGTSERRSAEFLEWEIRGRGYSIWPHAVVPEPPFSPFVGHRPLNGNVIDDGRKPTLLSSFVDRLSGWLAPPSVGERDQQPTEESVPDVFSRGELREIRTYLPAGLKFHPDAYTSFFTSLSVCVEPITFEIVATAEEVVSQFVVSPRDEALVLNQLKAFFPDVSFAPVQGGLEAAWSEIEDGHSAIVEFGLGKEFMIPLDCGPGDPFVGLIGALDQLASGEAAVFQAIFSPAISPWPESVLRSVTHADGSALFLNAPELLSGATEKTSFSLYAAVVRLAVKSRAHERAWTLACDVAGALGAYGSVSGNELIPLDNSQYPADGHESDVLARQSRRSGMIVSAAELAGFVHLPSSEVKSPLLRRGSIRTKAAPALARNERGLRLGGNSHVGSEIPVALTSDQRVKHIHVIGASGTGKSSLLYNCIIQDIENGEGVSVLDPHGDLIDRVLGAIPDHRLGDVVLLDPSDEESIVGFNILSAHSDWEKNLLAADLVSIFRRISSAWGDQLNSVLSNALLAFMESDRGGTLIDVRRFLLEPAFRSEFLTTVHDSNVVYYWQKAFPQLSGNKSVGPVVTRLDTFLSPKPIRYMVGQKSNRLNFREIMDSGKIFLAKLSQGAIGAENAHLLGSLIVSKIQAEAMARQRQTEASRRYHWLYIDEFHDFLTPSLAACLSGVRKYRLGLILSHEEMRQVERDGDVASALLNAYTRVVFRVNDRDAKALESGFASFEARDLQNLSTGQAVCRVERSDCDFNLAIDLPRYPGVREGEICRHLVTAISQEKYGTRRSDIEREQAEKAKTEKPPFVAQPPEPPPAEPSQTKRPVETRLPEKAAPEEKSLAVTPTDLGKGGVQHKAVQARIKDQAEKLGFRVTIEKEILDGAGSVDLVLVRDSIAIACEVSVTGTIDYEVGNVAKCIKAGYRTIAVVAVSDEKLAKLASAVSNSLGPEATQLVGYHLPDAFINALKKMPRLATSAEEPEIRSRGGRIIRRRVVVLPAEEMKAKEEQTLKLMAELMRKKKRT